jgi:D-amino-acid dehydrogenase
MWRHRVNHEAAIYDAIVVGGGIVGAAIAYHLVRGGARTLLIDRADPGRATDAGAGILTAETNGGGSDEWLDFAADAVQYYPALVAQLAADGAGDTGYAVCGQLAVAISEDEIAPFEAARDWMLAQQRRRGSPAPAYLRDVDADEARRLFPPLAPPLCSLYYRNAARVDGRLMAGALGRAAARHGLHTMHASADELITAGGVVRGVLAEGHSFAAGMVAIAGGAWSAHFADQLGVHIPVAPLRGQIIHLGLTGAGTGGWPLVTAFHGHYLVPWPDGRVVVGATHEASAGFAAHTSAAGVHEVLGEALRVAPGLAEAEMREVRVGLRPYTTADGLPVVGTVPTVRGAWVATGHGAYGLHLGPYTGKLVADQMLGRPGAAVPKRFGVERFANSKPSAEAI